MTENSVHQIADQLELRVVSMSPDNDLLIRRVIEIFSKSQQSTVHSSKLYDLEFWRSHIGSRFIALNIFIKRELVGYVSLIPFPGSSKVLFLDHFMIDPEYSEYSEEICNGLLDHLTRIGKRRNWQALYALAGVQSPLAHRLLHEEMGFVEIGFCPQLYLREGFYSGAESHCSPLLYRPLRSEEGSQSRDIYIPEIHREIVAEVIQSTGISRIFTDNVEPIDSHNSTPLCYDYVHQFSCLFLSSNSRDGLIDPESLQKSLDKCGAGYVAFSPHVPAAIRSAEILEERGFSFCGYLPNMGDGDYLLYFRPKGIPKRLSEDAELWRSLFGRYMLQYKHQKVFSSISLNAVESKQYASA